MATDAEGVIVGATAGGVPVPGEGEVYALAVTDGSRRRGVGTALLTAATERMRDHGALDQRVELPAAADPALPFYTRLGFSALSPTRWSRPLAP
ncbi:GNAT family N-acetyltransferase [Streptomyces sp. NPDC059247]|uniref:GNAT family N-acetyltransferase n=1 Tax=Streptomyces sp. NPDC059247 TaxID=3346790 RepID=UPI00368B9297